MRKWTAVIMGLALTVSLLGCESREEEPMQLEVSGEEAVQNEAPEAEALEEVSEIGETFQEETKQAGTEGENILIAYFTLGRNADYPDDVDASTSASLVADENGLAGTTEYVARLIQSRTGGELYSIETAEPYSADFDAVVDQNHAEQDTGALPELAGSGLDLSQYDTVFIGYPIWAGNAPRPVFTFLSAYDWSEKTIIPFCTHDGYGAGGSYGVIEEAAEGELAVLDGLAIGASEAPASEDTVAEWLQNLGLEQIGAAGEAAKEGDTQIVVTIGELVLEGMLYDTPLADEIRQNFPLTVVMSGYGGREYYGGVDFTPANAEGGQLNFENGDITYCSQNQTMAIFYAQTDRPDLTMEVIPIGKITSDLTVFEGLADRVEVTFALAE